MPNVAVLSRAEVRALLPPIPEQVDLVEETYVELAAGEVEQPPKPGIHPRPDAFVHAMPALAPAGERARAIAPRAVVHASARDAVARAEVVITAGPIVEHPDSPLGPDWLREPSLALPIDFDFYVSAAAVASADLFLVDDV